MSRDLEGAIKLIQEHEGFRPRAYLCPARKWTIGFGTTVYPGGKPVVKGDEATRTECLTFMFDHLQKRVVGPLDNALDVSVGLNQYNALVSFVYNVGEGNFRASTLRRKLNAGDWFGASSEFDRWVYGGGKKLRGLVYRRVDERALFEKPDKAVKPTMDPMDLARALDRHSGFWGGIRRMFRG